MGATRTFPSAKGLRGMAMLAMMLGMPLLVAYGLLCVLHHNGNVVVPDAGLWLSSLRASPRIAGVYLGWLLCQAAMYRLLPGRKEAGQMMPDGSRLLYRLNGLSSFLITVAAWAALHFSGLVAGDWIYLHLGELFVAANLVVWPLCLYVFLLGRSQANASERKKNLLEAFYLGATLNPRNGRFDWKFFCESRPGLTLWVLVALSCAVHQYHDFGSISNAMALTTFFITLYVTDYYVMEEAVLTTWDMIHEPFGWMLCWGSLVYVPFFYPLAAVWLAAHHYVLPDWAAVAIFLFGMAGYVIFRQSNLQKHRFRKHPEEKIWGRVPAFVQTRYGTRLLADGWWGIASHANYLGDLMLSLALCSVVGKQTIFGYSYFLVFVPLLIHRDWRDNRHCATKYGEDWLRYRQKVRWHILPGVY